MKLRETSSKEREIKIRDKKIADFSFSKVKNPTNKPFISNPLSCSVI